MGESEAGRLEKLWAGRFGNEYSDRNSAAAQGRRWFWEDVFVPLGPSSVLEVGCNLGGNLTWIRDLLPNAQIAGIDLNAGALARVRSTVPRISVARASARRLPFPDDRFDIVFTMGVLIHIPPEILPGVMSEIVRTSRRFVLAGEYHADEPTVVPYRGQERALFKCDFGRLYRERFPDLRLRREGTITKERGWDRVTWWLFEHGGSA